MSPTRLFKLELETLSFELRSGTASNANTSRT